MQLMGFNLQMGTQFGAGLTTLNLLSQLMLQRQIAPILLYEPATLNLNPVQKKVVEDLIKLREAFFDSLPDRNGREIMIQCPVLVPIGNGFSLPPFGRRFIGTTNLVKMVFEETSFNMKSVEHLKAYDGLIPVSSWNMNLLKNAGLEKVALAPQGIDPTLFHPAPKQGIWRDRFVIFSAGKLEFRKAQDLIIAAFKIFHQRHPDSLLCFSWHNFWPKTMQDMNASIHVKGIPRTINDKLDFTSWLMENGLPEKSFTDLVFVNHHHLPQVMREADVALFPNRCEGGTNLPAMEAMACGVPAIISTNTGHLDIISDGCCFVLENQRSVSDVPDWNGTDGWGESSIEEIVEKLETVYFNREEAGRRGIRGARKMINERSWEICARKFTEAVHGFP